jgi:hypothetical protein
MLHLHARRLGTIASLMLVAVALAVAWWFAG